jgi:hypothetical protein
LYEKYSLLMLILTFITLFVCRLDPLAFSRGLKCQSSVYQTSVRKMKIIVEQNP